MCIGREVGAKLELMTAKRLKEKFPWINTDGLELACLGLENEGWSVSLFLALSVVESADLIAEIWFERAIQVLKNWSISI